MNSMDLKDVNMLAKCQDMGTTIAKGILNELRIGYSDDKKIKHLKSSKYLLNGRLDGLLALFFVGEEEELI